MRTQIRCPKCNQILPDDPIINAAVNSEGSEARAVVCNCGAKITYWDITDQLKEQKKRSWKIKNWMRNLFNGRG